MKTADMAGILIHLMKKLTAEIEIVARAKGSPMMLPIEMPLRLPYWTRECSILRSDGE
jgi:hypothetical protein